MTREHARLGGRIVTEQLDYDGGRAVTAYLPDHADSVVYATDGGGVKGYAASLESSGIITTAIVGVHGLADETQRLAEYSPVFDADRFAAHETFFVEDVRRWARARFGLDLPTDRTAMFGASAGGELALALGLRHPEVYGSILSGSPGAGYRPPATLPNDVPRTYLVAGSEEPFFLENATRWSDALRTHGTEVVLAERRGEHGSALWQSEFPEMIRWAFGKR